MNRPTSAARHAPSSASTSRRERRPRGAQPGASPSPGASKNTTWRTGLLRLSSTLAKEGFSRPALRLVRHGDCGAGRPTARWISGYTTSLSACRSCATHRAQSPCPSLDCASAPLSPRRLRQNSPRRRPGTTEPVICGGIIAELESGPCSRENPSPASHPPEPR